MRYKHLSVVPVCHKVSKVLGCLVVHVSFQTQLASVIAKNASESSCSITAEIKQFVLEILENAWVLRCFQGLKSSWNLDKVLEIVTALLSWKIATQLSSYIFNKEIKSPINATGLAFCNFFSVTASDRKNGSKLKNVGLHCKMHCVTSQGSCKA